MCVCVCARPRQEFLDAGNSMWFGTIGPCDAVYTPAAMIVVERTINMSDCLGVRAVLLTASDTKAPEQLQMYIDELASVGKASNATKQALEWYPKVIPEENVGVTPVPPPGGEGDDDKEVAAPAEAQEAGSGDMVS